jgi:hypothetical protein
MPNDTLMGLGSYVASTTGFSEPVLLLATDKNNASTIQRWNCNTNPHNEAPTMAQSRRATDMIFQG